MRPFLHFGEKPTCWITTFDTLNVACVTADEFKDNVGKAVEIAKIDTNRYFITSSCLWNFMVGQSTYSVNIMIILFIDSSVCLIRISG